MKVSACLWIRDGVLVNRMHINPVAFAVSYWIHLSPEFKLRTSLEELINFGFEKSGYSCSEKMQLFNQEKNGLLKDIETAAALYNKLAQAAGLQCNYFDFACELLAKLKERGLKNFITSALEQEVLDQWQESLQGLQVSMSISEILGRRRNFVKGFDHFKYVSEQINDGPIYYVADAVSEIQTAFKYANEFNIVPIGFAYRIDRRAIEEGFVIVGNVLNELSGFSQLPDLNLDKIVIAEQIDVVESLHNAGAKIVVSGGAENIMSNLAMKLNSIL